MRISDWSSDVCSSDLHGSDGPSPSVASYGRSLDKLLTASFLSIANFPPPAVVSWRSKDGTPLRAEVDIDKIFKDRLIRHNVAREDIPEKAGVHNPDIVLVDRKSTRLNSRH